MSSRRRPRASSRRSASSSRRRRGRRHRCRRCRNRRRRSRASRARHQERVSPSEHDEHCDDREDRARENGDPGAGRDVPLDREPDADRPLEGHQGDRAELERKQAARDEPHGRGRHDEERGDQQRADGRNGTVTPIAMDTAVQRPEAASGGRTPLHIGVEAVRQPPPAEDDRHEQCNGAGGGRETRSAGR